MQMGYKAARSLGYQQIAIDTSQGLTVPPGTSFAMMSAESQAFRWRDDGVAPTVAIGMPQSPLQTLIYDGANIAAFRAIGTAAGCLLNVTYYAQG